MAGSQLLRAATLDGIGDLVDDTAGVHLCDLPPLTTVLVWTRNSLYRVVVTRWPEGYVQGGAFFPNLTPARVNGSRIGGSCLRVGWIGAGLSVEIRSGGRHIITSTVLAIAIEQRSSVAALQALQAFTETAGDQ